jgi:hypothetical protein
VNPSVGFTLDHPEQASLDHVQRVGLLSLSRLHYQWPECEVHLDMLEGVAARPRCVPRGLTGGNEALPRVHRHLEESQARGRAGLQARARSTSQRGGLCASKTSWTINRDKLNYVTGWKGWSTT